MARPPAPRRVAFIPESVFFKPAGVPMRALEEVCLSVEEIEAIRLKDQEELQQEECAEKMHISRPTFHRVLESARKKVADALINGKSIRIEGGNFGMAINRFKCANDGHEWSIPFETMVSGSPLDCPICHSPNIQPVYPPGLGFGSWGWRRGRGRRSW